MRKGLIALGLLFIPSLAHAAACGPHAALISITEKYGEVLEKAKFAYSADKEFVGLLEWTENEKTGTWTLLMTGAGQTCLVASGARIGPES